MIKKYIIIFFSTIILLTFGKLTYAQHDSDSLTNILLIWNLEDNFKKKQIQLEDSSAFTFHIINKEDKNSILNSNLGNLGSANISDIFIKREDKFNQDFSFNSPYYLFIKDSKNVNYYDTRRPFTSAMHSTSFKLNNIQTLRFTHTQNLNPNFNIAADFDYTSSQGLYIAQETSINSSSVTLNYTKDKYNVHASYIRNKIENQNSGGYDTTRNAQDFPPAFMTDVRFLIKNQELSATQFYNFGGYKNISYGDTIIKVLEPKTSISHSISLYQKYRVYNDIEKAESKLPNPSFFYQEGETADSTSVSGMSNKFRFASEKVFEEKNKFNFSLILEADLKEYYNFKDYIFLENSKTFFENNISGNISTKKFLNLKTSLYVKYYFSGYRSNDFRTELNLHKILNKSKNPINLYFNTQYSYYKPDYFTQNYYSNHYMWENEFENSERINSSFKINIPKYNMNLIISGSAIKNHVFYGSISTPQQYDSTIYIITAGTEKNFKLNIFYIKNKLYWQRSSKATIISLPSLAAYHSSFLKLDLKSNSSFFIGYEVKFTTAYKAKSFNSSTGQFYQENIDAQTIGNYPFIAVFFNMKIKKNVLLSLKYQHLNYKMMSVQYPAQINHYPAYGNVFRFAVRWTFKN